MARIAGVNIPTNKKVEVSLTYIFGIGSYRAKQICLAAKVGADKRVNELSEAEVASLRDAIDAKYIVEGELRKEVAMNIKSLKDMKCYRGLRHIRRLPVRGQRTHTNARTRKGKAIAIAGKKVESK